MIKLNIVQDEATPHNNVLIRALVQLNQMDINLWYSREKSTLYDWESDITNEVRVANIYGDKYINWAFIKYVIENKDEKFFLVGWSNPSTRLMVILFWFLRRPYSMWFDCPDDDKPRGVVRSCFRDLYYFLIRTSHCKVFCVGKKTIEYFEKIKFNKKSLVNLPVYVDVSRSRNTYIQKKSKVFKKYGIESGDLFLTSGSRLVKEKGFDILIEAISLVPKIKVKNIKLLIVGKGDEQKNLKAQILNLGLSANIIVEDWLDIEEFKACIASSDYFVHPARWDAYGSSIFAMSLGVAVIGSDGAGSVVDRITHEVNGFVYKALDKVELASIILKVFDERSLSKALGDKIREDSLQYAPEYGAIRIMENCN
jgi:glycosyltransferase involved in cell wall biosynthesis